MNAVSVARIVKRGDSDRYESSWTATRKKRRVLHALYAFNIEVSRASWITDEPQIANIRLQWWEDAVLDIHEGRKPPNHDVALELAHAVSSCRLPFSPFREMIAAYRSGIMATADSGLDRLDHYLDATSGNLMWLAARALDAPVTTERTVRKFAWGAGAARYLRALPQLHARGRALIDPAGTDVGKLVALACERVASARRNRKQIPARVQPAMLAGWRVSATLERAAGNLPAVAVGRLAESEFRRRLDLVLRGATGQW